MKVELPFGVTYWAAMLKNGKCQLNALVCLETIDTAIGKQTRHLMGPTEDLE